MEGRLIGNQIFRSGTSIAANYRAACRARSTADFVAKLSIVEEEADETFFWLELIKEMGILNEDMLTSVMNENNEILAIIVSSIKTSRKSQIPQNSKSSVLLNRESRKMKNGL